MVAREGYYDGKLTLIRLVPIITVEPQLTNTLVGLTPPL